MLLCAASLTLLLMQNRAVIKYSKRSTFNSSQLWVRYSSINLSDLVKKVFQNQPTNGANQTHLYKNNSNHTKHNYNKSMLELIKAKPVKFSKGLSTLYIRNVSKPESKERIYSKIRLPTPTTDHVAVHNATRNATTLIFASSVRERPSLDSSLDRRQLNNDSAKLQYIATRNVNKVELIQDKRHNNNKNKTLVKAYPSIQSNRSKHSTKKSSNGIPDPHMIMFRDDVATRVVFGFPPNATSNTTANTVQSPGTKKQTKGSVNFFPDQGMIMFRDDKDTQDEYG